MLNSYSLHLIPNKVRLALCLHRRSGPGAPGYRDFNRLFHMTNELHTTNIFNGHQIRIETILYFIYSALRIFNSLLSRMISRFSIFSIILIYIPHISFYNSFRNIFTSHICQTYINIIFFLHMNKEIQYKFYAWLRLEE